MLLAQHHITLAIPMHFPFLYAPARILNEPPAATADKLRHQLRDSGYCEEQQLLFFISMQADEKAWKSPQTSYRTRRSRDPVSSKLLFSLDSGQSLRDFRNDGLGTCTQNIEFFINLLVRHKADFLCLNTNNL